MIQLNDYLYSGDTVLKILQQYGKDLKQSGNETGSIIDIAHGDFLKQIFELLEHNEFLTSQSQRIREFYMYMADEFPYLAFTFKGRIKSLIRAEEKFNGYIVEYVYNYYKKNGSFPPDEEVKEKLLCFRDLIAYRIVISMPKCHLEKGQDQAEIELEYLYNIANKLPAFLEERGFLPMVEDGSLTPSEKLNENVKLFYRDYIENKRRHGYQSLHITFFDSHAGCLIEVQLRTKDMDDYAEIGPANHLGYEKRQEYERTKRELVPKGVCKYFDEAYERGLKLQNLDLAKIDVNMFAAMNNSLINDSCGLFRGRMILPFEHLSRFQNNMIE